MPYIELDPRLKPRKLSDINSCTPLPDPKWKEAKTQDLHNQKDTHLVKKYRIIKNQVQYLIPLVEKNRIEKNKCPLEEFETVNH